MQKIFILVLVISYTALTNSFTQSCVNTLRRYGANSHIFNANVYCSCHNKDNCTQCLNSSKTDASRYDGKRRKSENSSANQKRSFLN